MQATVSQAANIPLPILREMYSQMFKFPASEAARIESCIFMDAQRQTKSMTAVPAFPKSESYLIIFDQTVKRILYNTKSHPI